MPRSTTRRSTPARRPAMVAIEGLSGSGKTTLVRALGGSPGFRTIAEGYDRLRRRPSLRFRDRTQLLRLELELLEEDLQRYDEARRAREGGRTVVLDTDFLGPLTYVAGLACQIDPKWNVLVPIVERLRSALDTGGWGLPDRYVYLAVEPRVALQRAAEAGVSHPASLRGRHDRVGRWERSFFLRRLPLLLPGRVEVLRGDLPVPQLVNEVRRHLTRTVRKASSGEARRVLTWFEESAVDEGERATHSRRFDAGVGRQPTRPPVESRRGPARGSAAGGGKAAERVP
ncbi:MAG: ATP-binding protein [Thermoplasmata archaeon]|nr:ATP-binding protein [Thermoplasmata archaeon]